MTKQQEAAERGGDAVSLPVSAPAAEATERNGTGGSPFGGLSIDFSGDTTVGAPTAPAPLPEIAYDSPSVMTVPGGPGHTATGEGRTENKLLNVGSGPAGLTAAIYAARANLEPVVIAGSAPGGQLMLTSDVENYPGFVDGIHGPDLMATMRALAERFGTRLVDVDIDRVDFSERPFRIWARGTEYRAQSVIVATGASALWLGLHFRGGVRARGVAVRA